MDEKILSRLQAQCARAEYSEEDVLRKALKALGAAPDAKERAVSLVSSLVGEGYVSNRRYAAAFAREKSSLTGWGPVKIRFALGLKGISKEDIDAALESVDKPAAESKLMKLLTSRMHSLADDPQLRLKLLRFALGRGYDYSDVEPAVNALLKQSRQSGS